MTGQELVKLREDAKLTQRTAAQRLMVTERTLSRWENEGRIPEIKADWIRKQLTNGSKRRKR